MSDTNVHATAHWIGQTRTDGRKWQRDPDSEVTCDLRTAAASLVVQKGSHTKRIYAPYTDTLFEDDDEVRL